MRVRHAIAVTLGLLGAWQVASAGYIHAKALLAQELLENAWQRTLATRRDAHPWPWADTVPVARLVAPAQGSDLIVLAHASGRALAFGPAHVSGTTLPGEPGTSVIAGHRDTHFAFLGELRPGDPLEVQRHDGEIVRYQVVKLAVVDARLARVPLDRTEDALVLVTCFPLDAVEPGGPLRFEVTAVASGRRIPDEHPLETVVASLTK